jgi:very-short-patch-repair endonuclease
MKHRAGMTTLARDLRNRQTAAERKLWAALRKRQINGWKFRRQAPVGPFVVDFLSHDAKLVVEVDGFTHRTDEELDYDERRSAFIRRLGFQVLRLTNDELAEDLNAAVGMIAPPPVPSPGPSRAGRGT